MDVDESHVQPLSTSFPAMPSISPAHNGGIQDDLSDDDLSDLHAEIENNLSSASPESSFSNGVNDQDSDDAMDVDSETEVRPLHVSKGPRRTNSTKEYYDP